MKCEIIKHAGFNQAIMVIWWDISWNTYIYIIIYIYYDNQQYDVIWVCPTKMWHIPSCSFNDGTENTISAGDSIPLTVYFIPSL